MKYPHYVMCSVAVGMVGACVDARGSYEDYASRVPDAAPVVDIDGGVVSNLPNIDGEFYMVCRPDLPEDRLIHLRVTIDLTPITENTGEVAYNARFLDYTTFEPVGAEVTAGEIPIGSDASFDEWSLDGTVPAAANPISGSNAVMHGLLIGNIVSEDFLCGTATGTAGALALDGTQWAMQRITGDTLPPPVWTCADQP